MVGEHSAAVPDRCRRCGYPTPRRRLWNKCSECGAPLNGEVPTAPPARALLVAWLGAAVLGGAVVMLSLRGLGMTGTESMWIAAWCCVWISVGVWLPPRWSWTTLVIVMLGALITGLASFLTPALIFHAQVIAVLPLSVLIPGAPSVAWGLAARMLARRL
jgi:hypothetical protein